jgi:hypothetical protein
MNVMRIAAAAMLLGPGGCYMSSGGTSNLPDARIDPTEVEMPADAELEPPVDADLEPQPDSDPDCDLWNSRVFVDIVVEISGPVGGVVTVTLRGGQRLLLNVTTPLGEVWADILDRHRTQGDPVYLQVDDPRTMNVIDVLMPYDSPLVALEPSVEGMEVELVYSAAIHFLYLSHPCYDQMLEVLRAAMADGSYVLVSTDFNEGNGILDARPSVTH